MEGLFSPCTRYGLQEFRGALPELKLDVSTKKLLSAKRAFTYADLYAMLGTEDTAAWLTPQGYVVRADGRASSTLCYLHSNYYRLRFSVDGQQISAVARSSELLAEIVDVVSRLLIADVSEVYELVLKFVSNELFFNAAIFAHLVRQCQSLKALTLDSISIDEEHYRVLGNISKAGLEIELKNCRIVGAPAEALVEVLGRNQGPTKLDCCYIDYSVLANGLRGNSRLKSLEKRHNSGNARTVEREFLGIAGALKDNKGLVDLTFGMTLG
jgi:hypothetical protein